MAAIVRSLSFSRRRRSRAATPRGASGTFDADDTPEAEDAPSGPLKPLRSELSKAHMSKHRFSSNKAKRWFEVDDELGVLYQFKDYDHLQRRVPKNT